MAFYDKLFGNAVIKSTFSHVASMCHLYIDIICFFKPRARKNSAVVQIWIEFKCFKMIANNKCLDHLSRARDEGTGLVIT